MYTWLDSLNAKIKLNVHVSSFFDSNDEKQKIFIFLWELSYLSQKGTAKMNSKSTNSNKITEASFYFSFSIVIPYHFMVLFILERQSFVKFSLIIEKRGKKLLDFWFKEYNFPNTRSNNNSNKLEYISFGLSSFSRFMYYYRFSLMYAITKQINVK